MSHSGGRPSKYKAEYASEAAKLGRLGATDAEIADFFDVDVRTVHNWKSQHEEFFHSLKIGKEEADARVERALFQRAVGFEQDAVKIFMPKNASVPVCVPYRDRVSPDTTACIFWLKNRKPKEWRDKVAVEQSVDESLARRLERARERAQIRGAGSELV